MGNGENDVAALNSRRSRPPARAGVKAQLESRFKINSTVRLVQLCCLYKCGQILVIVGKQIHVGAHQLAVNRELERRGTIDSEVKRAILGQRRKKFLEELARRGLPINLSRPPVFDRRHVCVRQSPKSKAPAGSGGWSLPNRGSTGG